MPGCKEAAAGPSEYSGRRVWSPLADSTAWYKSLCWLLEHCTDSDNCHRHVTAGLARAKWALRTTKAHLLSGVHTLRDRTLVRIFSSNFWRETTKTCLQNLCDDVNLCRQRSVCFKRILHLIKFEDDITQLLRQKEAVSVEDGQCERVRDHSATGNVLSPQAFSSEKFPRKLQF